MSRRTRLSLFGVAAVLLAAVLADGLGGLPAFGGYHGIYGILLSHVTVAQRRATDVITAITFDYRGLDTMGEEFILFAASLGLVVLLREQRDERRQPDDSPDQADDPDRYAGLPPHRPHTSPALIAVGRWLIGPVLVLGIYIATHGQLTPGGGFQGGVVLAGAVILVFVAGGRLATAPIRPTGAAEVLEAAGAGGYVALGFGGLIAGARFLTNFLPLGTKGSLLSSGTIASLSVVVGLEVAGAITLIVSEFVDQRLLTGRHQ
ncbi:MAG: MnhB domain-containing protein [Solirubrobacteraceae bacterium]